jgi:hypothetical protein
MSLDSTRCTGGASGKSRREVGSASDDGSALREIVGTVVGMDRPTRGISAVEAPSL